jgi:hypothetical protein
LLVTADVPNTPIHVPFMMEAERSSKTSVFTRATRRNITEDGVIQIWQHVRMIDTSILASLNIPDLDLRPN